MSRPEQTGEIRTGGAGDGGEMTLHLHGQNLIELSDSEKQHLQTALERFVAIISFIQGEREELAQNGTSQEQAFRFLAGHLNSVLSFYQMVAYAEPPALINRLRYDT
ncbi:MAG: hypothetical protein KDE09_20830 [Anaerolineales bacterium]|nr:hypothetical protein [Anaerolineales bacterium]